MRAFKLPLVPPPKYGSASVMLGHEIAPGTIVIRLADLDNLGSASPPSFNQLSSGVSREAQESVAAGQSPSLETATHPL